MILLNMTYETWTPECVETGDTDDKGLEWQDRPHTFIETVDLIKRHGFIHPSTSHGVPRWISTDEDCTDYSTGAVTIRSLHPANDKRSQRYWAKACRAAGIIK